jgi:hypothetical protein
MSTVLNHGVSHMAKMTAQQAAAKWNRNFTAAADAMKQGVMAVTDNPAQKAIAAKDRYIAGVQRAYNDGSYERGLSTVTLSSWRQAYIDKGIPNAAVGARVGMAKYQSHEQEFGPTRDAIISALPPRGTDQENINRMVQFVTQMRQAARGG